MKFSMRAMVLLLPAGVAALATSSEVFSQRDKSKENSATIGAGGRLEVYDRQMTPRRHRTLQVQAAARVKLEYPYYHTSDELTSEVARLSKACGGALTSKTIDDNGTSIEVINVRGVNAQPVNRVFLLFGEHSRELISPESGLVLLRALCGEVNVSTPTLLETDAAVNVLKDNEFQIVLNANPHSRRKVEGGEYCLRTNPDGVDLNRNWDDHWQQAESGVDDSNPGPRPFSEPETRIVKRLVTDFRPTTFLTVHSGTRGMYMPWAYDREHLATFNQAEMMEILRTIDKEHCKCPFGAAGKEVGYPCPGTCLDYAYEKLKTPYVFAFEIYGSPRSDEDLNKRWEDKMNNGGAQLLQGGSHLGHFHFRDFFSQYMSDFVETGSAKDEAEQISNDGCFDIFNPGTEENYNKTVANWASAYIETSVMVAKKLKAA